MKPLLLAAVGGVLTWIFSPMGLGDWQATIAFITGLVAKENVIGDSPLFLRRR